MPRLSKKKRDPVRDERKGSKKIQCPSVVPEGYANSGERCAGIADHSGDRHHLFPEFFVEEERFER